MTAGFKIIAHRGASASRPENTLSSFERALEQGAREIELDVRFSSDEEIRIPNEQHQFPVLGGTGLPRAIITIGVREQHSKCRLRISRVL